MATLRTDEEQSSPKKPDSEEDSDSVDYENEAFPFGEEREFSVEEEDRWFLSKFRSSRLVTKRLPHLIVRTKGGLLAAGLVFRVSYFDELGVYCVPDPNRTIAKRLRPLNATEKKYQSFGDEYKCTNAEGTGTVTVYSKKPLECRYWVRELLGIFEASNPGFYAANDAVGRIIGQLKKNQDIVNLEEIVEYFNTDVLSILAYFCRITIREANLKGHVCHLFLKSLGDPKRSVHVNVMPRGQLEGVTLLRLEGEDYSLSSGRRVGYELMGEVFHVIEEGGSVRTIDDDALVGCDTADGQNT